MREHGGVGGGGSKRQVDAQDPVGKWGEGKRDVEQKEQSQRDKKELSRLSRKRV